MLYIKFNGLYSVVKHMIQRLDIAVHGIFLCTYVSNNSLGSNVFWLDQTAQIQAAYYFLEVNTVDLGNDLGMGFLLCIKGQ